MSIVVACRFNLDCAVAEKGKVLVIGNFDYKAVSKLVNPENDAAVVGLLLKKAGLDFVDVRQNMTSAEKRRVISDFSEGAKDTDITSPIMESRSGAI